MRRRYAVQSNWCAAIFACSVAAIFLDMHFLGESASIEGERNYPEIASAFVGGVAYLYGCWSYGYAKGYRFLGALCPLLMIFSYIVCCIGFLALVALPDITWYIDTKKVAKATDKADREKALSAMAKAD